MELPPETHNNPLGSVVERASYYANNMKGIAEVLNTLNTEDAESIKEEKS